MRIKYNQDQIEDIIQTFNKLKTYKEVSITLDIPLSSCKDILNREGYFQGGRKSKNYIDIEDKILNSKNLLKINKYSFNELCNNINVIPKTFKNYLIRNKIKGILENCSTKNKKKTSLTKEIQEKILNLEKEGKGNDLIGKLLKIDGGTVRKYLIEYYGIDKYKERHSIDKFLTPNYSGFINDRGDRFHSSLEVLVADYLFENNIKYKTQAYIKFENGKFIYPDFYLIDYKLYIEVFGMSEIPFYIKGMNNKLELYNTYKIEFLPIFYNNFKQNNWKEIIKNKLKIN